MKQMIQEAEISKREDPDKTIMLKPEQTENALNVEQLKEAEKESSTERADHSVDHFSTQLIRYHRI